MVDNLASTNAAETPSLDQAERALINNREHPICDLTLLV